MVPRGEQRQAVQLGAWPTPGAPAELPAWQGIVQVLSKPLTNQDVLLLQVLLRGSSKQPRGAWTPQLAPQLDVP